MDHKRWEDAERLAEKENQEELTQEVLFAQGVEQFKNKNYQKFETLALRAHRAESIIQMYKVIVPSHYTSCSVFLVFMKVK